MLPHLARHRILLGTNADGADVTVEPYGTNMMIAGTSGSGKSTLTQGLLERLVAQGYEFCLVDPEGDYGPFANAVTQSVSGSNGYQSGDQALRWVPAAQRKTSVSSKKAYPPPPAICASVASQICRDTGVVLS